MALAARLEGVPFQGKPDDCFTVVKHSETRAGVSHMALRRRPPFQLSIHAILIAAAGIVLDSLARFERQYRARPKITAPLGQTLVHRHSD